MTLGTVLLTGFGPTSQSSQHGHISGSVCLPVLQVDRCVRTSLINFGLSLSVSVRNLVPVLDRNPVLISFDWYSPERILIFMLFIFLCGLFLFFVTFNLEMAGGIVLLCASNQRGWPA